MMIVSVSCIRTDSTSVKYNLSSQNDFAKKTRSEFYIDTAEQSLIITVVINDVSAIKFPIHPQTKDTFRYSVLRFDFFEGTRPIEAMDCKCSFSYSGFSNTLPYSLAAKTLSFVTDTINLSVPQRITFRLPFFHLRNLSAGQKNLTLKIKNDEFYSDQKKKEKIINGERRTVYERERMSGEGMHVLLAYPFKMPKVYSSIFICDKITLQNDSSWSPSGSDFTIFRSSLPDIYYEIYTPANFTHHRSQFQKSTIEFNRQDTCTLYFYSPGDSLTIGVFDHDNFSRDDGLGSIRCTIKDLQESSSSPLKNLHVNGFYARLTNIKTEN